MIQRVEGYELLIHPSSNFLFKEFRREDNSRPNNVRNFPDLLKYYNMIFYKLSKT